MPFPLSFVPKDCFYTGGRRFGADREGGTRKHAACDLIADEGKPIYAIRNGVVVLEDGAHTRRNVRRSPVVEDQRIVVGEEERVEGESPGDRTGRHRCADAEDSRGDLVDAFTGVAEILVDEVRRREGLVTRYAISRTLTSLTRRKSRSWVTRTSQPARMQVANWNASGSFSR